MDNSPDFVSENVKLVYHYQSIIDSKDAIIKDKDNEIDNLKMKVENLLVENKQDLLNKVEKIYKYLESQNDLCF